MPKTIDDVAAERDQGANLVKLGDELAQGIGGPGLVASYEHNVCAFCGCAVNEATDFKDMLSKKDWAITRLCQKCQDKVYAEPEE